MRVLRRESRDYYYLYYSASLANSPSHVLVELRKVSARFLRSLNSMPSKKRVQSSTADPEATVVAASSSTEPAKEPTPPLQVSYCGSQSDSISSI